jgi:riboflavin kinase/FMN adenylyltransferase
VSIAPATPFRARPLRNEPTRKPEHYQAAVHVGPAPTFNDDTYRIEVHLLNYDGEDLYGERLTVELVRKIRDIKKFTSEEELKSAIAADCAAARKILATA